MCDIYLDNLPVELVYRIFDYLDCKTILFNIRYVCKYFNNLTNNYNRYKIDLNGIRMNHFHILCQKFNPKNVIKLILCNDDKTIGLIKMFLLKYNLNEFLNLRYLILSHIEDQELEISLKQLENNLINEISIIKFDLYDNKDLKHELLSNLIVRPNLLKLNLEFRLADVKDFPWPFECQIKCLRIGNEITFNQFYTILNQSIYLKEFILKDCSNKELIKYPFKTFLQLNSLTFEYSRMTMEEFQILILYIPNINYLKLNGTYRLADGCQLETLIRRYLPLLKTFQFYFDSWENPDYQEDFLIISSTYKTYFWTEEKHWFINCDYLLGQIPKMRLYSLPLSYHKFEFYSDIDKQSFTTSNQSLNSKDSVKQLTIDLNRSIQLFDYQVNYLQSLITI